MSGIFLPVLLICVVGGLIFAAIAFKTAKEASTALAAGGDPTKIQISPNLTVSTGNAVVALFILSVIFGTGVPLYLLALNNSRDDAPVMLETHLQPPIGQLTIASRDYGAREVPQFPIYRSSQPQHFKLTPSPEYQSVDLEAYYEWANKTFVITLDDQTSVTVPVVGNYANLSRVITLTPALIKGKQVQQNVPLSGSSTVTATDLMHPDPARGALP
jgi:hypothetical protein